MGDLIYKEESYRIIGICMEVHNIPGPGFLEIIYKDALEYEFNKEGILYQREKEYVVNYKTTILAHKFHADFVVMDKIVLEVKAISCIADDAIARGINYLKMSGNKLALVVNFGESKLTNRRVVF